LLTGVAMIWLNLSAGIHHRTRSVKLARTIADLAGSAEIQSAHLTEALHLRQVDQLESFFIVRGKEYLLDKDRTASSLLQC
jgi:predicted ATPase with chaperone activity